MKNQNSKFPNVIRKLQQRLVRENRHETDSKQTKYPPKLGQLFGFYAPPKKNVRQGWIQIHRVKKICSTEHRLKSWAKNVGQTNRKVLELTEPLCTIDYDEWDNMGGLKKKQGTYTSNLDNTSRKRKHCSW